MLEALLGNRSVERILLFLLLHERCYASQIHRFLEMALTPVQKALERLEKGGIVLSHFEGKIRVYEFNRENIFYSEVEALLQKAYHHLPLHEKKRYHIDHPSKDLLTPFWEELKRVRSLEFVARSLSSREIQGRGKGEVKTEYDGRATLLFHESGSLENREGKVFNFKNVFRWTYSRLEGLLSLEHLRLGKEHPVFLFHLAAKSENLLESLGPHLCGKDSYFGWIQRQRGCLALHWRILGPKKNEEIKYGYETSA